LIIILFSLSACNQKSDKNIETSISYQIGSVKYKREILSSAPDQILAIKISANKKRKISFHTLLQRPGDAEEVEIGADHISMKGFAENKDQGTHFYSVMKIINEGGELSSTDSSLVVKNADAVTLYLSACTDYQNDNYQKQTAYYIKLAEERGYDKIKDDHITDYQNYFNRVSF